MLRFIRIALRVISMMRTEHYRQKRSGNKDTTKTKREHSSNLVADYREELRQRKDGTYHPDNFANWNENEC